MKSEVVALFRQRPILLAACLILAAVPVASLKAASLQVNCDQSPAPGRLTSIGAALKLLGGPVGLFGPNTINVSGTCNENIALDRVTNLTLTAQNGASIKDASGGTLPVISVNRSTNFALNSFAVSGGGGPLNAAIACETNSTCYFSHNDVQIPNGTGIVALVGAAVSLDHDVLERSAVGLLAVDASRAELLTATIRNNTGNGAVIGAGSFLVTNFSSTIRDNGTFGIFVFDHSSALIAGTSITGNGSIGVFAQTASEVRFFPPATTISGNGIGVAIQDLSWANFYQSATTVSGSTTPPDIRCWGHFSGATSAADAGSTDCPT